MKTPKLYSDLLKKKQLTTEMIAECIYSVNKRAKNYRIENHRIIRIYKITLTMQWQRRLNTTG